MLIDKNLTFSTVQSVAAAVGDIVSTNIYDTGAAADVGIGEEAFIYAAMVAALAGVGSSIQVVLQTSVDAAFTAPIDAASAAPVVTASATAGAVIARFRLPIGLKRYIRLVYRISGATTTTGTVNGYMTKDVPAQQYIAGGFTVA